MFNSLQKKKIRRCEEDACCRLLDEWWTLTKAFGYSKKTLIPFIELPSHMNQINLQKEGLRNENYAWHLALLAIFSFFSLL